ncbi:MAG: PAS domain S-box protein [Phycisphaerales bacterium]|nr:PAS domain S-box protein [Phycisphaerales bacterium]
MINRRRWVIAAAFVAGALSLGLGLDVGGQPPVGREPEASLRGGTIRVGLPSPIGARGMLRGTPEEPQGFLREVMELVAKAEGLKIEFIALGAETDKRLSDELAAGRIDVWAGATVSEANLRSFRLSAPVIVTPGVAVTRVGMRPPTTVDELRKLRVVVPAGGAGRTFAVERDLTVTPKHLYQEGFDAVVAGEADAMLTTMIAARYEIERSGYQGLAVSVLEPVGFRRAYAYAARVEDPALMVAIESGLAALQQNGQLREIYEREVSVYQPLEGSRSVDLSTVLHVAAAAGGAVLALAIVWQWRVRRKMVALTGVLTESEQRYRGIFDQTQDAILAIDPVSRVVLEANPAAERTYGYEAGAMAGLHVNEIVANPGEVHERMARVQKDGAAQFKRSKHRRRDGRLLLMDVHAAMGAIGGKSVIVAMNRDVTAATSYEELIRSVIETSPHVAIQGFDKDGRVHFWNEASTRLYGWTAEESIGRKVGELIADPAAHAELVAMLATLEAERRPSGLMEFQVHSKNGEPRWVLSEIVPAPDLRGELQFVCVDIDVSAMKLVERRLQDAQARLASALEAAGTGTWSIDVKGQTIDPDPSLVRLLGLDHAKGGARPLTDIADRANPEDLPKVLAALGVAMRGEGPYRAEYRVNLPGGGTRWLSSRGKLIRDEKGEVVSISGACVDVTEAKLAAADADRLRDELERARRLESLGLLAGGLAHDFNNLLVGIRGNTELAMASLGNEGAARRALDLVVHATDRTADLTGQLLAAAGHSRLAPESIDLNAVAVESVSLLRPRLGAKVTVDFELAEPAVRTRADGAQTAQALNNLLTNAADALAAAGGRIVVRTGTQRLNQQEFDNDAYKVRAAPGEFAFIEVSDNGCGMDERVLARVFDPFYSTKATGRGLGLSLVLTTVRRHEGAIRIDSGPGKGTTCRLLLPLVDSPPEGDRRQTAAAPRKAGRALVIDDEPMVRQVVGGMLKNDGWEVTEVASGEEGIRCAQDGAFDVVFLDLTMPGLGGVDTAAGLRAAARSLPIVFVSGYSRDMAGTGGALAGEVFVQKPFDAATLLAAAAEAQERSEQAKRGGAGVGGAGRSPR